jgi:acyl carrier protein
MPPVSTAAQIVEILDEALTLNGRAASFTAGTRLLGALPELDSMAVVTIIAALEDRFGFTVNDDEIDGSVFETFGSLQAFVDGKLG